jgi:hypothetical protein
MEPMIDTSEPATVFKSGPPIDDIEARSGRTSTTPNRGGPTRARRTPTRRYKTLEPQLRSVLVMFNMVAMVVPPLQADALDEAEIFALAKALDQQARQSPRFRKALEGVLSATSSAGLISVIAIIGARRAARHGAFGEQGRAYDPMLGAMIGGIPLDDLAKVAPDAPTEPVAA